MYELIVTDKYCRIGNQSVVQMNWIFYFEFFRDVLFRKANIEGNKYSNDRNDTSELHYTKLTKLWQVWQIKPLGLISNSTV